MFSPIITLCTYFPLQFIICLLIDLLIMASGVLLAIKLYNKGTFDKAQRVACIILFIWSAIVLFMTVLGRRMNREDIGNFNFELFKCYRQIFVEHDDSILTITVQNILMFIPVGYCLSAVLKNISRFILPLSISILFTLLIEGCQLILKSGIFELDDLFNNTAGALIGIIIYIAAAEIIHKHKKAEKRAALEPNNHT